HSLKDQFQIILPQPADDKTLELVHTREYINAIRAASLGRILPDIYRYVSMDNLNPLTGYIPQGIEEGARLVVGTSVLAAELVVEGKFKKAVGIGGGMHHAKQDYGEGFCFYNDVAISIQNLKKKYGLKRILVLDTDAHAGNGVAEIFYTDPEVLFIDIHQDPRTLYPGTGFMEQIGSAKGRGFTINLCLQPQTGNRAYEYIFEEIVFPLTDEFKPEIIIRYGGSDPHYQDPLTSLGMTLAGFKMLGEMVHNLSEEFSDGKAVDLILSGYNLKVLPFAWLALISGLLDLNLDLSGLKEESPPPVDSHLEETKEMVGKLKGYLKRYWRCMAK
ncbi:MAG: histone deacetylase, partial [Candidatus Omnitrophica bacterium]|nr:histone deacetylase [Candidatus Omnitrophota bacterium]